MTEDRSSKQSISDHTSPTLSSADALRLEAKFKSLASQTRLSIIYVLMQKHELSVTELAMAVKMSTQAISNQLRLLEASDILKSRRNGNQILYSIADDSASRLLAQALEDHEHDGHDGHDRHHDHKR